MKFLGLLACLFVTVTSAHAGFQPNDCNDGGVYRSMVGPDVKTDAAGNKSLSVQGIPLIECKVGNTTTCVGTTYNNYTCQVNFFEAQGAAAKTLTSNINFGAEKGVVLTHDNSNLVCGFMHCFVENTLVCADGECRIKPILSGWDE